MAAILNPGREGVIKDRQGKFCNRGKLRRRKNLSVAMKAKWSAKETESSVTSSEFGDAPKQSGSGRCSKAEMLQSKAEDELWSRKC